MQSTTQHYRVTLEQAKRDYKDGLLTATGLVYYAIAVLRPVGQKLRIKQSLIDELNLNKRTFTRVLSKLRLQDRIDWQPTEDLLVWITPSKEVENLSDFAVQKSAAESKNLTLQKIGQIDPLGGQIDPLGGQIDPLGGQIDPLGGQIDPLGGQIDPLGGQIDPLEASKPALSMESKNSHIYSDIYQIFINSLSNSERENFLNFSREAVAKLPSKPVLPETWIKKNHLELWRQYKGTDEVDKGSEAKAIAVPTLEQTTKLQELKNAGEIKDFYSNSQNGGGTIVVDTGSAVLFWWEFLESVVLEA